MKPAFSTILLGALLLAGTAHLEAAEVYIGHPTVGGKRIDICLEWGSACEGEAAEVFCKAQGYDRMVAWEQDPDIGATHPTLVLGSGQVCAEAFCDGYFSITCAREDEWTESTGNGGAVIEVIRNSGQSPEGILIVAVSIEDVATATAAVAGVTGLALLRTPPGAYMLLIHDHQNAEPIPPQPGHRLDVPPGKSGGYAAVEID